MIKGDLSMKIMNKPVQMIFMSDTGGKIRPIKFRYEEDDGRLISALITDVRAVNEMHYVGIEIVSCICKANIEDLENIEKMYEVRYFVKDHKWILFEEIY